MSIPNLIPHKTLYISGYIYSYYAFVFIFEFPEHISKHILQFHTSLTQWLSKYISVYLWLPISDLFGAILARLQVLSIQKDMEMLAIDPSYTFSAENGASLVFLLIGICGYFTIPSIAGWIVHASGIGSYNRIVTHLGAWTLTHAAGIAGSTIGNVAGRAREGVRRHIDVRSTKINKK